MAGTNREESKLVRDLQSSMTGNGGIGNKLTARTSLMANIFGTDTDKIQGEDANRKGEVRFHPKSVFRGRWDFLMCILILYSCIATPIRIAFGATNFGTFAGIDVFIDMLFILDVAINFQTGYDDGGLIIRDQRMVRKAYLKTGLLVDCISAVPYDLLLIPFMNGSASVRLPLALRIFRLPRFFRYMGRWSDTLPLNTSMQRIMKLVLMITLFSHFNGCLQFYISELEDFPEDGWVSRSCESDSPYRKCLIYASRESQYLFSIYKSLSHMLCIGYGQEAPRTQTEIWITMLSMAMGASMYILLIGMMSSIMLSLDRAGAAYREQLFLWKEYFAYLSLPHKIRSRVLSHFERQWFTRKYFEEQQMLNELSPALKHDVMMHITKDLIAKTPLFKACRPIVLSSVVPLLVPITLTPGELVYKEGAIANDMFFIMHGTVNIESGESEEVFTTLQGGAYFGEFPLLYEGSQTRSASARAATDVELFILRKTDFDQVTAIFPEVLDLMRSIADARTAIFNSQHNTPQPDGGLEKRLEREEEEEEKGGILSKLGFSKGSNRKSYFKSDRRSSGTFTVPARTAAGWRGSEER